MDEVHLDAGGGVRRVDAIVLGAGISGLVSASVLSRQPNMRVLLIDEYDRLGGNHIDYSANGCTFDIGSLIFQDDSPLVDHFPELLSRYVPIAPTWGRLSPQGKITSYPISLKDDVVRAGPYVWARIAWSVVFARLFRRKMSNAKDFARFWIGAYFLHRSGLESYMRRFYGTSAENIDIDLARKRMMWIAEHASLRTYLRRLAPSRRRNAGPANRQMVRPREGFAALYQLAAARLQNHGVEIVTGSSLRSLRKCGGGYALETDADVYVADRVISTVPIHRAEKLCGLDAAQQLPSITLVTLYFSFAGERGFDHSIIYNFSHDGAWKRLTVYSDFYGRSNGREYFAVEVIGHEVGNDVDRAERDFRQHVANNRLFVGDLTIEGSQILEDAYPIYRHGASRMAERSIERLRAFGVESFGRQGGFNYQPTARASTVEAEAALGLAGHTDRIRPVDDGKANGANLSVSTEPAVMGNTRQAGS